MSLESRLSALSSQLGEDVKELSRIVVPLAGQYLCDPNEINGWGPIGYQDNTNSQDLGNVGAANITRVAGGIMFPFDVELVRFQAVHYNSNGATLPWGWVIARQEKLTPGNTVNTSFMLDESFDRGHGQLNLRDYGATTSQETDVSSFVNQTIPAGETVVLGVGSPTAVTTNYYVRMLAGFFEFKRIF